MHTSPKDLSTIRKQILRLQKISPVMAKKLLNDLEDFIHKNDELVTEREELTFENNDLRSEIVVLKKDIQSLNRIFEESQKQTSTKEQTSPIIPVRYAAGQVPVKIQIELILTERGKVSVEDIRAENLKSIKL